MRKDKDTTALVIELFCFLKNLALNKLFNIFNKRENIKEKRYFLHIFLLRVKIMHIVQRKATN